MPEASRETRIKEKRERRCRFPCSVFLFLLPAFQHDPVNLTAAHMETPCRFTHGLFFCQSFFHQAGDKADRRLLCGGRQLFRLPVGARDKDHEFAARRLHLVMRQKFPEAAPAKFLIALCDFTCSNSPAPLAKGPGQLFQRLLQVMRRLIEQQGLPARRQV